MGCSQSPTVCLLRPAEGDRVLSFLSSRGWVACIELSGVSREGQYLDGPLEDLYGDLYERSVGERWHRRQTLETGRQLSLPMVLGVHAWNRGD